MCRAWRPHRLAAPELILFRDLGSRAGGSRGLQYLAIYLDGTMAKCGKCAECTQRVAVQKRKAKEQKARHRAGKRAAGDERENEQKREKRAANKKATLKHTR